MQISIESIQEVEDPYQAFADSIKSSDTFRKYKNHLHRFLKLVTNQIYLDVLNKEPENDSIEELSKFFVNLGQKDPKIPQNIVAAFIKEDRKQVERKDLSPNTFPSHIKAIQKLLAKQRDSLSIFSNVL